MGVGVVVVGVGDIMDMVGCGRACRAVFRSYVLFFVDVYMGVQWTCLIHLVCLGCAVGMPGTPGVSRVCRGHAWYYLACLGCTVGMPGTPGMPGV